MIKIESNFKDVLKGLNDFEKKQLPFAISKALNDTAMGTQVSISNHISNTFNTGSNWFKPNTKFGVKRKNATKRNSQVEIYTDAYWLEDFEEGDFRTGTQLIPTKYFTQTYGLKKNKAIKKKLKKLKNTFKGTIKGDEYIMQRVKGKQAGRTHKISKKTGKKLKSTNKILNRSAIPLFIIKRQGVQEKVMLMFEDITSKVFERTFDKNFDNAMAYAMIKAR